LFIFQSAKLQVIKHCKCSIISAFSEKRRKNKEEERSKKKEERFCGEGLSIEYRV